jgi:hypothetical protein
VEAEKVVLLTVCDVCEEPAVRASTTTSTGPDGKKISTAHDWCEADWKDFVAAGHQPKRGRRRGLVAV